jgi:tetratricopeptide (TPR) repeat protein
MLMATNSAPGESSQDTAVHPTPAVVERSELGHPEGRDDRSPRDRPLWQAPVFVLGVAALVGMGVARPFAPETPVELMNRQLRQARHILERSDGDLEQARDLARDALEAAGQFDERIGEAALLLGTAHMRLAEKADSSRGEEDWRQARQYLEQADKAGVSDADQPHLLYRLGKVGFFTGDPLQLVIDRLEEATPRGDNRAEGYGLLTRAYLKLQPPNLSKALENNKKLRDLADASEDEINEAKLLGGELLLRLGKPEAARKDLKLIPRSAKPDILMRARLLCARSHQDEKQWGDAAQLYHEALAEQQRVPIPDLARVYYDLGLCYRQLEQPQEAAKAWQECMRLGKGEESPAAALVLADLHLLQSADYDRALDDLTAAVARVSSPGNWNNPLIDKTRALGAFERAYQAFRKEGRYDLAMRLLEPYSRLATPLQVLVPRGTVAVEWAKVRKSIDPGSPLYTEEKKAALELYVKAGEAFAEASTQPGMKPAVQGHYLWSSATAYLAAGEPVKAAEKWEQFVKLDVDPEKLGEAWYRLGEINQTGKDLDEADKCYRRCMDGATHFAPRARYRLAMMELEKGNVDQALAHLVNNVHSLRFASDTEVLAQSQFALGNLLYQRKDYRGAYRPLEAALEKLKDDPRSRNLPDATRARFQLADCYRQIASLENQGFLLGEKMSDEKKEHLQKEHKRWLLQAAEEFARLNDDLDTPPARDHLSQDQRGQVPFITAKCWFNLGHYEKALEIYERLIERFPETVEGLDALGGAVSCHAALGQLEKVRWRLLQIKRLLPKMPDDIRPAWEKWWKEAIAGLGDLAKE